GPHQGHEDRAAGCYPPARLQAWRWPMSLTSRAGFQVLAFFIALFMASPAIAQWSPDSTVNLAVCAAAGGQFRPQITSDGAGGTIIVWQDGRAAGSGADDYVYAQRLDADGVPQWAADGVFVGGTGVGAAAAPVIISDGAGGAIMAWVDLRAGGANPDVYA